jgi:hypothetical protein
LTSNGVKPPLTSYFLFSDFIFAQQLQAELPLRLSGQILESSGHANNASANSTNGSYWPAAAFGIGARKQTMGI